MNTKIYHWILYIISCTIITTIAVQVYWNYNNYQLNKQQIINEIQLSLDNAIEEYYAGIAKSNVFPNLTTYTVKGDNPGFPGEKNIQITEGVLVKKTLGNKVKDSIFDLKDFLKINNKNSKKVTNISFLSKEKNTDSIQLLNNIKSIYISIQNDSINYTKLDSLLNKQLNSKNLAINYQLFHFKDDSIIKNIDDNYFVNSNKGDSNSVNTKKSFALTKNTKVRFDWKGVNSKSTFLKNDEQLKLLYKDTSFEALKRSSFGIGLSLLLSLAIIFSLFYLLHIINKQKKLDTIKNDLISNITHEFKTPITTISTALEAMESFDAINDKVKTKKYLSIASSQLKKFQQMVEKLLETATLDNGNLYLKKERTNLFELVKNVSKHPEFIKDENQINFQSTDKDIVATVDIFHLENAL